MDSLQESLLARITANYLFLSQFETFRASLANLRAINPRIALSILQAVIQNVGQIPGITWSPAISSPAHLSWLCFRELLELRTTFSDQQEPLLWGLDHCSIQYKLEALFLLQQLIEVVQNNKKLPVEAIRDREAGVSGTSSSSHVSTQVSGATISDVVAIDIESREDATEVPSAAAQTGLTERKQSRNIQDGIVTLKRIYDARCAQLRSDITNAIAGPEGSDSVKDLDNEAKREPMDAVPLDHQDRLCQDTNIPIDQNQIFVQISVCEPQLLDALCWIIERQKRLHTKLGGKFSDCAFEHGTVLQLQVQEAMLTVIKEDFDTSDVQNCLRYLRYLHSDFGTSESAYRCSRSEL